MSALVFAGAVAAWLLLLCGSVAAWEGARTLKRREFWRKIMAGLVGLSSVRFGRKDGSDENR